jgi:carbamoyl-phosphate synthase small subunit
MKAVLGLENGRYFFGEGFGVEGKTSGELVFTTQMAGYMEALTDPGYHGQVLLFTYPLIGNYGVDRENFQNPRVWAEGCVIHELCRKPAQSSPLHTFFEENGLIGVAGIDTRHLTISIREQGTVRAALVTGSDDWEAAVDLAQKSPDISSRSLIPDVSCKKPWHQPGNGPRIAVLDLGIKANILKSLSSRGGDLHVFPHDTKADEILACRPDGLFISNGPGDPMQAKAAIEAVRELTGQIPIFGTCMGNLVCGLSLGADYRKMKFGHRGSNQPVRGTDGRILITSQNHGFVIDDQTLPEGCRMTYVNCNDGTLEGFEDSSLGICCVQFVPEAHAGPCEMEREYFDKMFRRMV